MIKLIIFGGQKPIYKQSILKSPISSDKQFKRKEADQKCGGLG